MCDMILLDTHKLGDNSSTSYHIPIGIIIYSRCWCGFAAKRKGYTRSDNFKLCTGTVVDGNSSLL